MAKEQRITVSKNGPYLVSGGIPLQAQTVVTDAHGEACEWCAGKKVRAPGEYALCRCGHATTKPFCSGAHQTTRFDGTETASRKPYLSRAETIDGPELKLTDAKDLCSSARFCDVGGGIWDLVPNSDKPEAKRLAIQEAANCPSGRLVVWDKAGKAIGPDLKPSIGLVEDPQEGAEGPLWVRGGIPIEAADGTVYEIRQRVTLCRCGRSANKPFCDGAHLNAQA